MSGHKRTTISISECEYRRLHDTEMKSRFMDRNLPELLNEVRKENRAALSSAVREVETRQLTFLSLTRSMSEEIKAVEWAAGQALAEKALQMTERFEQSQNKLQDELQHEMDQFTRRIKTEMAQESLANQAGFSRVQQQFNNLADEHRRKQELALSWAQSAALVAQFIVENYPPELIDPIRVANLENELRQVFLNLEQEIPEAAIATAQQIFNEYSRLRIDLESQSLLASLSHRAACSSLDELFGRIESLQVVPALDMDGNPLDLDVDVDFWTEGRLGNLAGEVEAVRMDLEKQEARYDIEIHRKILEIDLPAWENEMDDLVFQARLSVLNSQIRVNIAELIVRALQDQGFRLRGGNYLNDDMRGGFEALVQSLDGSEVVIRVDPMPGQEGSADVHLISLDQECRSEQELTQRAREISRTLEEYGLAVGDRHLPVPDLPIPLPVSLFNLSVLETLPASMEEHGAR